MNINEVPFIQQELGKVLDSSYFSKYKDLNIFIENLLHNPELYLSKLHKLYAMYIFGV